MEQRNKNLGQYFTPKPIAEFMCSLISHDSSSKILEPSAGKGVFLKALTNAGFKNIRGYEYDRSLPNESSLEIEYRDFLSAPIEEQFDVIIGNPPYVRWKNIPDEWKNRFKKDKYWSKIINGLGDLTYAFIYHAANLLRNKGELIFICPLFWSETLHGKQLREHLLRNGSVELLINLNEAKVFNGTSSTIIIFKYVKQVRLPYVKIVEYRSKNPVTQRVIVKISELIRKLDLNHTRENLVNEDSFRAYAVRQFLEAGPWHPVPPNEKMVEAIDAIDDVFYLQGDKAEIGNGMVSGLDKAFKMNGDELKKLTDMELKSLIYIYKANTLERFFPKCDPVPYIFVNDVNSEDVFGRNYPYFFQKLSPFKEELKKRYSYCKNIPWWHWVFLRNKTLLEQYRRKIVVPSKERYDVRGYFRFALITDEERGPYYVTQDVTAICLKRAATEGVEYVLGLLNSDAIQRWIMFKGFNRGGVRDFSEEPLQTIPIPRINWNDSREKESHRVVVELVKEIVSNQELKKLDELNYTIEKLLKLKSKNKTLFQFSVTG
jgi:adenine-specific DNA-methyltransferase